jgi:hypothetical protein
VRILTAIVAAVGATVLGGCGDTLQVKPIPHNILEGMVAAPYPVYWLGGSFEGLAITEATHDPGGAFSVQYGNCLHGGQGTCTPPLRLVSSPDNSFVPGSTTSSATLTVRGVRALAVEAGRTIVIPTGSVIVSVYAERASLASAAAAALVPINAPGSPGAPLPKRLPASDFGSTPLPSQLPTSVRPLG